MLDDLGNNAPGQAGEPAEDSRAYSHGVLKSVCEWGVPTRIHAIGDRSVRYVLDCFEEAERLYGKRGIRHCMEHDETVQPEDLPRFAQLGISPCMQPWHMLLDMGDLARTMRSVPDFARRSWPIRSLLASGANVSLGSDFPVVGIRPMEEVYGAVYRMLEDGSNPRGLVPPEGAHHHGRGPARLHVWIRIRHGRGDQFWGRSPWAREADGAACCA